MGFYHKINNVYWSNYLHMKAIILCDPMHILWEISYNVAISYKLPNNTSDIPSSVLRNQRH